ncbi:hypothetical protein, partial [Escherichia coli]|uniref:hypothetical protein n=1 Tax=Escherichia coli TaxID=562 RepID=UPI001BFD825F
GTSVLLVSFSCIHSRLWILPQIFSRLTKAIYTRSWDVGCNDFPERIITDDHKYVSAQSS